MLILLVSYVIWGQSKSVNTEFIKSRHRVLTKVSDLVFCVLIFALIFYIFSEILPPISG